MTASLFKDFYNFNFPQPQYLGAKYKHLHFIVEFLPKNIKRVADAFAGSQSVAYLFKQIGHEVHTNDFLSFSHKIGEALIQNTEKLDDCDIKLLLSINKNPSYFNLMQNLFTDIFFKEEEAKFLDSFRSNIEHLDCKKQSLAFSIINRSITRKVTMGHFAHTSALKYADKQDRIKRNPNLIRPIKDIFLELVPIYNNSIFDNLQHNISYNLDAIKFTDIVSKKNIDLIYFDPPYCGSHADYQAFYHLLETYTQYWKDKEFINGTKRYSPKKYSGFDTKKDILPSFEKLFYVAREIPCWLLSYNDRSFPDIDTIYNLAKQYKNVSIKEKIYKNSVGGKGSVRGSKEILLVCTPK